MSGWLAERDELAERITNGAPAPTDDPCELPWPEITIHDSVFQHRTGPDYLTEAHTRELTQSLEWNGGRPLDAILVYWIGDSWACLDGHHRLSAYKAAGYLHEVPVRAFRGTLDEAIAAALQGNSKAKRPMSKDERSEAAWRLVISTGLSKSAIHRASCVSESTVANMRAAAKTPRDAPR